MKKIIILIVLMLLPLGVFADTSSDTDVIITQMKSILDQYGARVKALEAENTILRNEIMKAGIKIPLTIYSSAIVGDIMTSSGIVLALQTSTWINTASGAQTLLNQIATQYSSQYAWFITRIHTDWTGIQGAYKMSSGSSISGFEFIKRGNNNNVFVDITYPGSTASWVYDAKILYEYSTGTFQRKLIGFFEFNKQTGYYITRTGSNPFAGVERTFIADPYVQNAVVPPTASTHSTSLTASSTWTTLMSVSISDIEKAYGDKRYLTVISLSNGYLQSNPPSLELLRIRYRTFFIIGKYSESLAEITKIEALWQLDKAVACDAQVIATYSKNQTLVDSYAKVCGKNN